MAQHLCKLCVSCAVCYGMVQETDDNGESVVRKRDAEEVRMANSTEERCGCLRPHTSPKETCTGTYTKCVKCSEWCNDCFGIPRDIFSSGENKAEQQPQQQKKKKGKKGKQAGKKGGRNPSPPSQGQEVKT